MIVVGRVLDPSGKPVSHATDELIGRPRRVITRGNWLGSLVLVGRGETDSDGRCRLDALRTSTVRYFSVCAVARAPVLGWAVRSGRKAASGGDPPAAGTTHSRQAG